MADMLQSGMAWLSGRLQSNASQAVTYRRGAVSNASVLATLGQSEFPRESQEGLTTEERTQDFLIAVSQLTLSSAAITPEPGDIVVVADVGTFEVCSPGNNAPAWRYSDPYHTLIRIHTREIAF